MPWVREPCWATTPSSDPSAVSATRQSGSRPATTAARLARSTQAPPSSGPGSDMPTIAARLPVARSRSSSARPSTSRLGESAAIATTSGSRSLSRRRCRWASLYSRPCWCRTGRLKASGAPSERRHSPRASSPEARRVLEIVLERRLALGRQSLEIIQARVDIAFPHLPRQLVEQLDAIAVGVADVDAVGDAVIDAHVKLDAARLQVR